MKTFGSTRFMRDFENLAYMEDLKEIFGFDLFPCSRLSKVVKY